MKIDEYYDVIIVGAGPAGSLAAYTAAKENVKVLLLEKDREIGTPVRCAEAVGKDSLDKILDQDIDPKWLAATIKKFRFVAPDGSIVYPQVPMIGYVLNRQVFDYDLAMYAAKAGAVVRTKAYVSALHWEGDTVAGVKCRFGREERLIRSKIVIGADGVESRVGRWAKLDTTIAMRDMETCSQMTLANLSIDDDTCAFYFSQKKFPGGYAWVFPKGNGTANVGLGISGNKARQQSASSRLTSFVEEIFPSASVLNTTVGGVPCANRPERISAAGLLLAGDAAMQTNPVSGGGIATGMTAGRLAGQIAAAALKENDFSAQFFDIYEKEWDKACGNSQKRYYRLKEGISKLTDEQLNKTASALKDVPQEKQTLVKIFQTALIKQPALLVDVLKTLSPFSKS